MRPKYPSRAKQDKNHKDENMESFCVGQLLLGMDPSLDGDSVCHPTGENWSFLSQ